ncbi:hypothetical protein HRbin14_02262 [bacterium HR14]|nr:hypothetical protein HRbin14_02262 [bacterium HR14]
MVALSDEEIEDIYSLVKQYWEKYLKKLGVGPLPRLRREGNYTRAALVLVYLAQDYPNTRWVTKKELTDFVRRYYPETPDVQEGRHLGMQRGFYVASSQRGNGLNEEELKNAPKNAYRLVTLEKPHPSWRPRRQKAEGVDFESIKQQYSHRCAICGSKEGEAHLRYPEVITRLQKAHRNPHKEETTDNTIPLCEQCNRADRDRWVYDKRGRVVGVAKAEVVINSIKKRYLPEAEVEKLKDFLVKRAGGDSS